MTRTALELIGQSGLGYSFDPLTVDGVPHPYGTTAKLFSYVYSSFPWNNGVRHHILLTTIHKVNFIQDGIQSNVFPGRIIENWNSQVPTICHESFALEESP